MKKRILFIITCVCMCLMSCDNDMNKPGQLTDTYWASESSIPETKTSWGTVPESFYYRVWHFSSESEGTIVVYDTRYDRVDIAHGEDPARYGLVQDYGKYKIEVTSFNYPLISVELTGLDFSGNTEVINYNGEFVAKDILVFNNTLRLLKINK